MWQGSKREEAGLPCQVTRGSAPELDRPPKINTSKLFSPTSAGVQTPESRSKLPGVICLTRGHSLDSGQTGAPLCLLSISTLSVLTDCRNRTAVTRDRQ